MYSPVHFKRYNKYNSIIVDITDTDFIKLRNLNVKPLMVIFKADVPSYIIIPGKL